ncbi:MAG: MFS transporter [Kiloniellales bacterium]
MEQQGQAREPLRLILAEGRWAVFLLVLGGIWLHAADSIVVATVMPAVVADLGGIEWTPWAFALYELGSIVAGALAGLASLRLGVGRSLAMFAAIFALGCLASGIAPDMATLLGGRVLQGIGGGALTALSHVAVTRGFPERHWIPLFGLISAIWGVASLAGPLIGGLFSELGWWRGAFLVFAAKGFIVAAAAPWLLSRVDQGIPVIGNNRVPWASLMPLVAGVLAIAAAGVVDSVWLGLGLVVLGMLLLAAMQRIDARAISSLLPQRALRESSYARCGLGMALLLAVSTIAFLIYGPLLLEAFYGIDALTAGYFVAFESIAWTLAALAIGRVKPEGEPFFLRLGALTILVGLVGIALVFPSGSYWLILPFVGMQGAGFGMAYAFIVRRVVSGTLEAERDHAAGAVATVQMLGYAFGAAVAGIAANAQGLALAESPEELVSVVRWLFLAFTPFALAGVVAAWRLAALPPTLITSSAAATR